MHKGAACVYIPEISFSRDRGGGGGCSDDEERPEVPPDSMGVGGGGGTNIQINGCSSLET